MRARAQIGVEKCVDVGVFQCAFVERSREMAAAGLLALARGFTLAAAARQLDIGEGTARQYLKSIFGKTGVRRQAELVKLLLRSLG